MQRQGRGSGRDHYTQEKVKGPFVCGRPLAPGVLRIVKVLVVDTAPALVV